MRVLVLPSDLVLGGASLNAVELAAAMLRRGHEVLVGAPDGPLLTQVRQHGIDHLPMPLSPNRPTAAGVRAATSVARLFRPDVIHTYEFASFLSTSYGPGALGVPHLGTVMSMWFPGWLPRTVPVTLGTKQMVDEVAARGRGPVWLLEPPVDVAANTAQPEVDGAALRRRHGIGPASLVLSMVTRMDREMKLEGILDLVAAVDRLASSSDVALLLVGGGPSEADVQEAGRQVNVAHGRVVVALTGPLDDPRAAYATADVVVGMGSSIIKAMAFGKPAVVVGLEGFVRAVEPGTWGHFDRHGFWGVGADGDRVTQLEEVLLRLLQDRPRREELGRWSAEAVRGRFSLERGADLLTGYYEQTVEGRPRTAARAVAAAETALHLAPPPVRKVLVAARRGLTPRTGSTA